eukprot:TRINITY_DN34612_c0_g1_i1.p1 TRINITY_DN34612_c0_g1~~TRINITY_DN34612_c0_g1_i1.p1  ORF type:complete len:958 (+),score=86.73 TRINITY_DN34612_c0_g1_i1:88-2961(+)
MAANIQGTRSARHRVAAAVCADVRFFARQESDEERQTTISGGKKRQLREAVPREERVVSSTADPVTIAESAWPCFEDAMSGNDAFGHQIAAVDTLSSPVGESGCSPPDELVGISPGRQMFCPTVIESCPYARRFCSQRRYRGRQKGQFGRTTLMFFHWVSCLVPVVSAGPCWLRAPSIGCQTDFFGDTRLPTGFPGDMTQQECAAMAQHRWVRCKNAGTDPFEYTISHDPPTSFRFAFPPHEVAEKLRRLKQPSDLSDAFTYVMAFFWATSDFTQFSDIDISQPSCGREWEGVRTHVHILTDGVTGPSGCRLCAEILSEMWSAMNVIDPAWFPFSGARTDCFLGELSMMAVELLCSQICTSVSPEGGHALQMFGTLWWRLQLHLEVLLFFLEMPLQRVMRSGWPVTSLLAKIGAKLQETFEAFIPNECDLLDDAMSLAYRSRLRALVQDPEGSGGALLASNVMQDSVEHINEAPHACPFGHTAAILALSWVQAWAPKLVGKTDTNFHNEVMDAMRVWDLLQGDRVGQKRRFFYDLLTTRWPLLQLLEGPPTYRPPAFNPRPPLPTSCTMRVLAAESDWLWHNLSSPFLKHGLEPLAKSLAQGGEALASALCQLDGLEVLFMSGTSSGFKWGSFTVRGRQAARGLRQLRPRGPAIRARAWNQNCSAWCSYRTARGPEFSNPAILVHIKYPCRCAIDILAQAWPRATLHVYDPVDQFALVPRDFHAVLAQTSTASVDYGNHPSARADGVRVFWHPLHHSNFLGVEVPVRDRVEAVGGHTTHNDTELFDALQETLRERFPTVEFKHIDPADRFKTTGGHIITPQHTEQVYQQLGELDIAVVRHAGCMAHLNCMVTRRWFCDRYKTGQRLVNTFAAGLPAVLWNEQGFLDVVAGSTYPAIARSIEDATTWVARLISDSSLRAKLRAEGLRLSQPYALPRISERLVLVLADLLALPPGGRMR